MSNDTAATLTRPGIVVAVVLVLALALSPLLLVLTPIIPIGCLVYILAKKASLGRYWGALWWATWGTVLLCCWPFLGVSAGG